MPVDQSFLGTGWSFPPEFNKAWKNVKTVSAEDDILESLHILLTTSPGERIMQPDYGCGLRAMVFETMNDSTITAIKDVIERAVLFYEPRITLDGIEVDAEEIYDGLIKIQLNYTIRATNSRSNMVYPFYFQEGANIQM